MRPAMTVILAAAAIASCVADRSPPLPLGAPCAGDDECDGGLRCVYGRCRAECTVDRDCPEGGLCVSAPDEPGARVCTFEDETCGNGEACPPGLACGPDGRCREPCEEGECGPGQRCEGGACFECGEVEELCNGVDDDCDGDVDEGPAEELCPAPEGAATTACRDGACEVVACEEGVDDCDGTFENGCETPLDTVEDCGACGNGCEPVRRCAGGDCVGPLLAAEWTLAGSGLAEIASVAVGDAGEIVTAGSFTGDVALGEGPESSAGGRDGFVLAQRPDGETLWRATLGGTGDAVVQGLAPRAAGGALVAGEFSGELDYGSGPIAASGDLDGCLLEVEDEALHLLAIPWLGGLERYVAVAADPGGSYFAVWNEQATDGAVSMHVEAVDEIGRDWPRAYVGDGHVEGGDAAFVPSGRPVVVGSFEGFASVGAGVHESAGGRDVIVALLDPPSEDSLWDDVFGGPGDDVGLGVGVGPDDAVCVVGSVEGEVDLGDGPEPGSGGEDGFVRCLTAEGVFDWSARLGGDGDDRAYAVAVGDEEVVVVGEVGGPADLGSGERDGAGGADGFVAAFGRDGTPLWDHLLGGTGEDVARDVALDGEGRVVVVGRVEDEFDLGGGPRATDGEADGFVLLLILP